MFLTLCTHQRRRLLTQASTIDLVHVHLLRTCAYERFAVLAYCFMPDHVHLLLLTTCPDANATRLAKSLKQTTAFHFKNRYGQRLWQRSYFDWTLRADQDVKNVIAYLVMNPVRAGIANSVAEYPFWGSSVYDRREILDFVALAAVAVDPSMGSGPT